MLKKFRVRRALLVLGVLMAGAHVPAAMAEIKPLTVRYASPNPGGDPTQQAVTWFIEEVSKRSDGKIQFEQHLGNSLIRDQDLLGAIGDGVVDMGKIFSISYPGQLGLWNIANIPFTHPSPGVIQNTMHALEEKYPAFDEELKRLNVRSLGLIATGGTQIVSRKPLESFEDLKGLKVRARGVHAAAFVAAGAAPVSIPWGDVYEALSKGVVDATTNYILSTRAVRHNEVAEHYIAVDLGQALQMEVVNLDFWNNLTKETQELFTTVMREAEERYVVEGAKQAVKEREFMETKEGGGLTFSRIPDAEIEKWKQASPDFLDLWAKQVRAKVDTKAIAADFLTLQEQLAPDAERNQQVGMW